MAAIGEALFMVGGVMLTLSIWIAFPIVAAWHIFYYELRVRKPLKATAIVAVITLWLVGAAIGFA